MGTGKHGEELRAEKPVSDGSGHDAALMRQKATSVQMKPDGALPVCRGTLRQRLRE